MFSIEIIECENKKKIERQRALNIKATTKNEKRKLKRQKKKLKEKIFTKKNR